MIKKESNKYLKSYENEISSLKHDYNIALERTKVVEKLNKELNKNLEK